MDLSIVFGTYNRRAHLERCLRSIRASLANSVVTYEVIVTDGGSTDGSLELIAMMRKEGLHVWAQQEPTRRGAVAAYNDAFDATDGALVVALNDDVEVVGDALARLPERFSVLSARTAQLALAYAHHACVPRTYRVFDVHNKTYANYAVTRREALELAAFIQGGYWNPLYHTYAGDTELSCWLWKLGFRVVGALDLNVIDYEAQDALRAENNSGRNREDGRAFHARWPSFRHLDPDGLMPLVSAGERERYEAARAAVVEDRVERFLEDEARKQYARRRLGLRP